MIQKADLIKRINEEGLYSFNARISLKMIDDSSLRFEEFDDFISFVKINDIKNIFYFYILLDKEEFLINNELQEEIEEDIYELIKEEINQYNEKIETFDFTRPALLCAFSIYSDKLVSVILEDYWDDDNNLMKAEKMLEYLHENYEDILEQKEIERQEKLESLKNELKKHVINDDNFKICTNKDLRKNYAQTLIKSKIIKKYSEAFLSEYSGDLSIQSVVMFVEVVWAEYKNLKNNLSQL